MVRRWAAVTALLFVLLPGWVWAQAPKIVSTEWLAQHLQDPNQRIVDVREKITDYWTGHIPGAQYLNVEALRCPQDGLPVRLLDPESLARIFTRMGVTADSLLVIYAEQSDYKAAYLAWVLDYLGHTQWAIVDGGFKKWSAESRPVTQDYPKIISGPAFSVTGLNPAVRCTIDQVIARGPDTVLVDVRTKKLYTGEEGPWKRKGHIPGAVWHSWSNDLNTDGTWIKKEELQPFYQMIGVFPDKTIMVTCGQGAMTAHTYITLKYILGVPHVTVYDGSFSEWSVRDDLPVVTGETPN